jgi:hypothetical protein
VSAPRTLRDQVAEAIYRLLDVTQVLDAAVCRDDRLTAQCAAATITELGDRIEQALLTGTAATRRAGLTVVR